MINPAIPGWGLDTILTLQFFYQVMLGDAFGRAIIPDLLTEKTVMSSSVLSLSRGALLRSVVRRSNVISSLSAIEKMIVRLRPDNQDYVKSSTCVILAAAA